MTNRFCGILTGLALTAGSAAQADVPQVVTDIAPVHSIVAAIMEGVGTPELIVDPSASAHHMQLKPSQMRLLQDADLMVWIGPMLTPWMEKAVSSAVAPEASLVLSQIEGVLRKEGVAHNHDHGGEDDHDDHDDHEGHDDHADHEGHDDHDEHAGHDDHDDHGGDKKEEVTFDPHLWLLPDNAILWVQALTQRLIEMDPDNAETYASNALEYASGLALLSLSNAAELRQFPHASYIVGHDALGYLEAFYDRRPIATIIPADGSAVSVARVKLLQGLIAERDIACIMQDAETPDKIVSQLVSGADVDVIPVYPLGRNLELGPDLYFTMMTQLHEAFINCLSDGTGVVPASADTDSAMDDHGDHKDDKDHDDHEGHDH